jgi:integration host factor subunit beta
MLKGDIVTQLSNKLDGFLKKDLSQAVDLIMETISANLANGSRVEIRGFGSFSVRPRNAKITKNPKTGKIMNIPARNTLHFAMSKYLKEPLIENSKNEQN